ncbi:MAG: hypothetical protein R2851_11330 [Caldilineaceae bacterium]
MIIQPGDEGHAGHNDERTLPGVADVQMHQAHGYGDQCRAAGQNGKENGQDRQRHHMGRATDAHEDPGYKALNHGDDHNAAHHHAS